MTRPRLVPLFVIVAITMPACGRDPTVVGTASGTPAIRVVDAPLLPDTVQALPDLDVAGYEALLGQLEGTPVVVNVWATWCDPCRRETPLLAEAARRLDGEVQFIGVDILDNREAARDFLAELDVPYPSVFDAGGAIRTSLGSIGQPVTVFYAADGTVVSKMDGELSEADLEARLDELGG